MLVQVMPDYFTLGQVMSEHDRLVWFISVQTMIDQVNAGYVGLFQVSSGHFKLGGVSFCWDSLGQDMSGYFRLGQVK
jgi:hypothetical protein